MKDLILTFASQNIFVYSIAVITNDQLWDEFVSKETPGNVQVHRLSSHHDVETIPHCDAYFDLLFELQKERLKIYENIDSAIVFVNCVQFTTSQLHEMAGTNDKVNLVRINAWPGFAGRSIVEVAESSIDPKNVFEKLNREYKVVPDQAGFISARVIAMIINEAYLALGEKVSTKEEIDTAMKLGTNYPFGPFEWAEKIGIKNIHALLTELSKTNNRYTPAPLLEKEWSTS